VFNPEQTTNKGKTTFSMRLSEALPCTVYIERISNAFAFCLSTRSYVFQPPRWFQWQSVRISHYERKVSKVELL